jgi:hypothetical protein
LARRRCRSGFGFGVGVVVGAVDCSCSFGSIIVSFVFGRERGILGTVIGRARGCSANAVIGVIVHITGNG